MDYEKEIKKVLNNVAAKPENATVRTKSEEGVMTLLNAAHQEGYDKGVNAGYVEGQKHARDESLNPLYNAFVRGVVEGAKGLRFVTVPYDPELPEDV